MCVNIHGISGGNFIGGLVASLMKNWALISKPPLKDFRLIKFLTRRRHKNLARYKDIGKRPSPKTRRPVVIITDQGVVEGESRRITESGVFLHCKKKLSKNETYRVVITLPQKRAVEVKGQLVWSNLDSIRHKTNFSDVGVCFVKVFEEDRRRLNHAVSALLQ